MIHRWALFVALLLPGCSVAYAGERIPASSALSPNYPLELVSPRAVGTSPAVGNAAIDAGHRIFKAYPGLEYNIRAVVIGGAYPYTFSLSGAPRGMTIHERTGLIVWPNPQADASPTITVRDAAGTVVSSTWGIAVTTSGFRFLDSLTGASPPTGTGTIDHPWRSLSDVRNTSTAAAGGLLYFRTGTYDALDLPRSGVGGVWERVEFSAAQEPVVWLAYPGERPVIDFGFKPGVEPGVLFRFGGGNVYLDGLETRSSRVIGFQAASGAGSHYRVFRRLVMRDHNKIRVNLDGSNAAFIMTTSAYSDSNAGGNAGTWAQYLAVQDCEFRDAPAALGIKIYSQWKLLIEGNTFRGVHSGTELKADMAQFTYRGNIHSGVPGGAIGGNMHSATTHGEILFNLVNEPSGQFALDINQDGQAKRIDIYRNTFVGRVRIRNTDSADGPFRFSNNIIVNDDAGTPPGSHLHHEKVSDPSRISPVDNLAGAPGANLVDPAGALAGKYSRYLRTHGHQIP